MSAPLSQMKGPAMNDSPIRTDARHARRKRSLPHSARCACGETDPRCLTNTPDGVRCYGCQVEQRGRSSTEAHHPAGRHNLITTVRIPANEHRILSARQQSWPTATLRNPDGSPLLQAAAAIRGWMDVLALILERTVSWIPHFLEALDTWLRDRIDERWWSDFLATTPDLVPPVGR